jgi:Ino eighty subunit 1
MSSLQHILSADPDEPTSPPAQTPKEMPPPLASQVMKQEHAAASDTPQAEADTPTEHGDEPMYTSTTTSTRRNASGSVSSVYSGNKIRHLKKEDGIPFWRKDIQYDFLKLVFYDQTKCFSKYSDGSSGFTFAEIYIDAMAKSSKCSKILKEKLLQDTDGAISMAMVCLLVNVGRMNTTLNCKRARQSTFLIVRKLIIYSLP